MIIQIKTRLLLIIVIVNFYCYSQDENSNYNEAIEQVIDLYKEKQIVAIGENHGRLKESNFRLELIKNPEFTKTVDVIIIEFANPLYQETIDNYVNGKKVVQEDLKKVWQNTTQVGGVWDSPVYEQFFVTVRNVNSKLKDEDKIRVIAADPPIDWNKVNSFKDFEPFSNRGRYPVTVIEREVYNTNLKALLVFGTIHTELWGIGFTAELEKNHPNSIAVIMPPPFNMKEMNILKGYINNESKPLLINLEKNKIGQLNYNDYHFYGRFNSKLKNAGHHILFLGFEKDSIVNISKEIKENVYYQNERRRRLKVLSRS